MSEHTDTGVTTPLAELQALTRLSQIDTLYRDLYLETARQLLQSIMDEARYRLLVQEKSKLESVTLQSRAAIEHRDWARLPGLVEEIRLLRLSLDQAAPVMEQAAKVYGAEAVCIDPFSPGLQSFLSASFQSRSSLRETAVEILEGLARNEAEHTGLYRQRLEWFRAVNPEKVEKVGPAVADAGKEAIEQALSALNRGDVDDLVALARKMSSMEGQTTLVHGVQEQGYGEGADLSPAFPSASIDSGRRLGLEPQELEPEPEISSFIHQWAWQPGFPDPTITRDGRIILKNIGPERTYPKNVPDSRQSTLDLFMIHPFINSGGARYIPRLVTEQVLAEDFSEDNAGGGSGLLEALHLPRRAGLSRTAIEQALLQYGPQVVRTELGLDPVEFRLACIPYDVYCRLGEKLGLGNHPHWTHFDGYQVLKSGKMHALVGGDVRFGGIFDLCSISPIDERDGLLARFVVLRRRRFYPW